MIIIQAQIIHKIVILLIADSLCKKIVFIQIRVRNCGRDNIVAQGFDELRNKLGVVSLSFDLAIFHC